MTVLIFVAVFAIRQKKHGLQSILLYKSFISIQIYYEIWRRRGSGKNQNFHVVRPSRRGGKGIEDGNVGEESKGGNEGVLGPAVDDVLGPGDDGESAGSEAEKEGM
jgi:hypothetical protein